MKWAWKVGSVGGVEIRIHATFLILLAWVGLVHYLFRRDAADVADGIVFILILFGIVVLHELGHSFAARRFGIRTRDITLLPIGGVSRLERMPEEPRQELVVALAGPLVNVVLAGVLFAVLASTGGLTPIGDLTLVGGPLLPKLLWVNVSLAAFNLLPAFPMDGGRVVRALLALRMDYVDATQAAAHLGQGMALLFGLLGLLFNPLLIFIALFVWMGASQEASLAQMRWAMGGIPVRRAMITDFRTLAPGEPLARAVELVLSGSQQEFPVVESGRVVGFLAQPALFAALRKGGEETPVRDVMRTEFDTAHPSEMMEAAFGRLQASGGRSLAVLDEGRLTGLVTLENLGELLAIRTALRHAT